VKTLVLSVTRSAIASAFLTGPLLQFAAAPPSRTACSGRQTGIEGSNSVDCSSIMSEDESVAESLNLSGVE